MEVKKSSGSMFMKRKSTLGGSSSGTSGSTTNEPDNSQVEEYQKRNTRQIPSILLEDEIEKEEDYPFDFEKYYYESKEINREISRELVIIPNDQIQNQIDKVQKENRVSSLPNDYKYKQSQHVDDCIQFYSSNSWKSLKTFDYYKDENPKTILGQVQELRMEYRPTSTVGQMVTQNTVVIPDAEPDKLHFNYLERHLRKDTVSVQTVISSNNNGADGISSSVGGTQEQPEKPKSLFSYFTLSEPVQTQIPPTPYQKDKPKLMLITCKELQFKLWEKDDEYEPFFCSIYLFDTKRKLKISETFYFDFNNEKSMKLISNSNTVSTSSTPNPNNNNNNSSGNLSSIAYNNNNDIGKTKNAIFSITPTRGVDLENIYLVLKVDKVLMGDLDDQAEPYIKPPTKDKERDKLKESIKSSCARLGQYRQSFAWGCIPLFEEGVGEGTLIKPLYKSRVELPDAQLFDTSKSENSKSASTKKMKVIPGHCMVDIREITPEDLTVNPYYQQGKYVVNSSLVALSSQPLPMTPSPLSTPSSTPTESLSPTSSPTVSPLLSSNQQSGGQNQQVQDILPPLTDIYKEVQELLPSQSSSSSGASSSSSSSTKDKSDLMASMSMAGQIRTDVNMEFVNNLYIYPESLNFSARSGSIAARNITCKIQLMECDDNINFDGLKLIYGKSRSDNFVTKAYTTVTYHSKTPIFNDEIKIRLPITMSPNLHLLFTFYHITCQKSDKDQVFDTPPVGHAVLPLIQNGKLIGDDTFSIPVGYEFPPRYMKPETETLIRYIDNKKPVFQIRTKLNSTVFSTDDLLNVFFKNISQFKEQMEDNSSGTTTTTLDTISLMKSIKSLVSVRIDCIIQFFPIILNQLFRLMTIIKVSSELSVGIFMIIGELLSIVSGVTSNNNLIESYAKYVFTNNLPNEDDYVPVYEVLIKTWLEIMRFQEQQNPENILRFSTFFFNIIFKSMSLSLIERSKREENKTRKGRFVGIRPQLAKLIYILRWETVTRVKYTFKLSKELIRSIGHFCSNLLSIADRGYVFKIIERVVSDFDSSSENENETELNELKFEFLRIICQNDYFVQLNIPLPFKIDSQMKMSTILGQSKHFLSDLLLQHIGNGLSSKIPLVRMDAANSLRDTLIRLEMDNRWNADQYNKQRIVGVFMPYLGIVVNNWYQIKEDTFIMKRNILISFIYLLRNIHPYLIRIWWKEETKAKYQTFFEILLQCQEIFEYVGKVDLLDKVESSTSIRTSTAKSILEDYYFRGTSPYGSKKLYNNRSLREKRVDSRKSILDSYNKPPISGSGTNLTVQGDNQSSGGSSNNSSPGNTLTNSTSLASPLSASTTLDKSTSSSGGGTPTQERLYASTLRNEKRLKGTLSPNAKLNLSDYDDRLESNLAHEISSIILDVTDDFMYEYERDLKTNVYSDVLERIFQLLNTMMKKNQPLNIITKLYSTLRQFIFKFSKTVFEGNNSFCLDLCDAVILHCNSPNQVTREEAATFTYILFKQNYEQTRKNYEQSKKNFVRTKTQITIGLSKIVKSIKDDYYLSKSLQTINTYAQSQAEKLGIKLFAKQIEDLTKRLHTFVIDNIKINNHKDDPEMVADLYHRIAENNKSNAELRICWLQSLVDFHSTQENYVEAAQCYLHMASLVSEYLNLIHKPIPTIAGSTSFLLVNKNSLEESNSYIEREEDGNDNQAFTMQFFMKLVLDAIQLLKKAEYYETANLVYKLIIPVYENNLSYEELANCHGDLQDIFRKILECTKTQSRMLGSYYRVVLYGKAFEEYSGMEFIYKEPKITRLVEIKDRLRTLYAKKLNVPEVEIQIIEGSQVDITTKDPSKYYLQITSVVPYFTEDEQRKTIFDRSVNLNKFIFETPFTESGAGRGNSVADQYKRKTILTTQNYFPYTKKRIQVISKQEIILSPIENSIETIEQRTEFLNSEVKNVPPNIKTLQQVLQGTLRIQVNSGPQEICKTFLTPTLTSSNNNNNISGSTPVESSPGKSSLTSSSSNSIYPQESITKLKKILSTFLGSCSDALMHHKSLSTGTESTYQEFQDEMEQGYLQLHDLLETFSISPPEGSYHPSRQSLSSSIGIPMITTTNSGASSGSGTINGHSRSSSRNSGGLSLDLNDPELSAPLSQSLSSNQSTTSNRRSFTQRLSNSLKKPVIGLDVDD
ncbi:DOCK family protein [Tieghemostelium lacteum]|uniref:DOCK family protein n=1 Tax=Tieghemostelium lacteum TaxID=361077 RepID=A0A151ZCC1_TIELA|nr:DOCK family protein [Tieghemostelium lacteum]|eukprot:KYQ91596.1 DOCK family protein [Tieghemostelium lacteum]